MSDSYAARTKYDLPGRARRYAERSPRRDEEEWRLLQGVLRRLDPPPRDVLDVPCGTGRVAERLLAEGLEVRCGDLSPAMRALALQRLEGVPGLRGVEALDLDETPVRGPVADLVLCFRFLHHLPDAETRCRVLGHLARLARHHVVVSFHHPVSFHHLSRGLRRIATGRVGDRHTLTTRRLRREAHRAGLELVGARGLAAWRRELWVAWLRPVGRTGDAQEGRGSPS